MARCADCHTPPLFTNQQLAVLGTPEPDGRELDPGAQQVVPDPESGTLEVASSGYSQFQYA